MHPTISLLSQHKVQLQGAYMREVANKHQLIGHDACNLMSLSLSQSHLRQQGHETNRTSIGTTTSIGVKQKTT